MPDLRLLAIPGSLRAPSQNRKLLAEAVARFGPAQVDWAELDLPLYDGDLEARLKEEAPGSGGLPEGVARLVAQIRAADAVAISMPEYNKGITGVLKNALDWVSRAEGAPLAGKPTAVMSANAGRTGGETGQYMLRACLVPFRAALVPAPSLCVAAAAEQFDEAGKLVNERYAKALDSLMSALREAATRYAAGRDD